MRLRAAEQPAKGPVGLWPAGRAEVDWRARGNGLGVGATAWIPALCALGLRKQAVDRVDQRLLVRRVATIGPGQREA